MSAEKQRTLWLKPVFTKNRFVNSTVRIYLIIFLFVFLVSFFNAISGLHKGDIMFRFRERQAVTFLSALMLGFCSLISLCVYLLQKKFLFSKKQCSFWLWSTFGFFFLCMDEYFMIHEGLDELVLSPFIDNVKDLGFDGAVIGVFGLIAVGVCYYFREALFAYKQMIPLLLLGSVGLMGTVFFHNLETLNIVLEVLEESFKFLGVTSFFAAYLTVLFQCIKKLPMSESRVSLGQ